MKLWDEIDGTLFLEVESVQAELESVDPSHLVEVYNRIKEFEARVKEVVEEAKVALAKALDGRSVRYGDYIYDYAENWTTICIDRDGFFEWLSQQPLSVQKNAFNPNYVRKTGIGDTAFDTFFEKRKSEQPTLRAIPVDRAPQYKQALKDGEVA